MRFVNSFIVVLMAAGFFCHFFSPINAMAYVQTVEKLVLIRGNVAADGTIEAGKGFRVAKLSTGLYLIIFDGFYGQPTVNSLLQTNTGSTIYGLPYFFTLVDPEVTDKDGKCQADPQTSYPEEIIADKSGIACMKVQTGVYETDRMVDRSFMFEAYVLVH